MPRPRMKCIETPFPSGCIYAYIAVLEHQMSLKLFDTQLGAQGMEDIGELWHCLVSFLLRSVVHLVYKLS
jgi:hypothetical protein